MPSRAAPQLRRTRWVVLFGLPLLTACSPVNVSGVTMSDAGRPKLVNCGAYFRSVDARDKDSGETLWSAHADETTEYGVGEVEVGVLPADDWEVVTPLEPGTSPDAWRFDVTVRNSAESQSFEVAASDLASGRVLIFEDRSSATLAEFDGDRCDNGPLVPLSVVLPLTAAAVVGIFGFAVFRRRRTRRPAP